ncbi:transposon Tf2-9 polyprotein [Nephila pilipes]|uniref:Transposon Tf2-9 polyprotein n=1 Tax=Nephila pilipes TaxID=299642 RepID=A0A8X6PJS1_NEPPI|nr:transposon Tf2-9 polyprotein [Nephila pilipes]
MLLPSFRKQEARLPNKFINFGRCENRHRRTENFKPVRRYCETHPSKDLERRTPRRCCNCHSSNYLSYNRPEVKKESEQARPLNSGVQTCFVVRQKWLPVRDITLGDKTISVFIDTGSSVSFICENVSTKIVDQQKFSNKYNILSGIGKSNVLTKGSFKHDLVIDEDCYSLTWYVVPTKHLNFEAIIGTDILEQASLKLTEEGVEFHKYEGKNYQDQKESIRPEAKGSIQEIKPKKQRTYKKKRKKAPQYEIDDLVEVQHREFGIAFIPLTMSGIKGSRAPLCTHAHNYHCINSTSLLENNKSSKHLKL